MYDKIKCATGWAAAFAAFGYGVWATSAASDGPDGIGIPLNVAVLAMTAIILLALTSIVMRVGDHAADRVIERLADDHFELLVSAVTCKLRDHHQQLQQMVRDEVAAALEENSTRAFRAAIVRQASAAAADTDASVTRIPTPNGRR